MTVATAESRHAPAPGGPAGPGRATTAGPTQAERWLRRVRWYLPAVLVFVGTIGLWEVVVRSVDLGGLPLPAPSEIWTALTGSWGAGRWPIGESV